MTFTWQPFERCLPQLQFEGYQRLAVADIAISSDSLNPKDALVQYEGNIMTFGDYQSRFPRSESEIKRDEAIVSWYAALVGRICLRIALKWVFSYDTV